MDSNHWQIVERTLAGQRPVDEETFASLEILTERLQRVKKLGKPFTDIGFSFYVDQLKERKNAVTVG
ncbi:MAG: hypothetical protein JSV99_10610 [Planctomycetota bacterium]|nr:MAG: hypothetical protein JSV99_10610 [Planctomycetota bacterium]